MLSFWALRHDVGPLIYSCIVTSLHLPGLALAAMLLSEGPLHPSKASIDLATALTLI